MATVESSRSDALEGHVTAGTGALLPGSVDLGGAASRGREVKHSYVKKSTVRSTGEGTNRAAFFCEATNRDQGVEPHTDLLVCFDAAPTAPVHIAFETRYDSSSKVRGLQRAASDCSPLQVKIQGSHELELGKSYGRSARQVIDAFDMSDRVRRLV